MLRSTFFTVTLDLARRVIYVVDPLRVWLRTLRHPADPLPDGGYAVRLQAGQRQLDGWLVAVPQMPPQIRKPVALLILHGIGERLSHWRQVQAMLAAHNVTSLIFDYSGYGRSQGVSSQANLEDDVLTASTWLRQQTHDADLFVLGYSMGTGLAAELAPRLAPAGVILCECYTTYREAAARVLGPLGFLRYLVPDLWRTRETIRQCPAPVLILHGDADALFPVAMGRAVYEAARAAGVPAELVIVPGCVHNGGYLAVEDAYWGPVLRMLQGVPHAAAQTERKEIQPVPAI